MKKQEVTGNYVTKISGVFNRLISIILIVILVVMVVVTGFLSISGAQNEMESTLAGYQGELNKYISDKKALLDTLCATVKSGSIKGYDDG